MSSLEGEKLHAEKLLFANFKFYTRCPVQILFGPFVIIMIFFRIYKVIISGLLFQYMKRIICGMCHTPIVEYKFSINSP